VSSIVDTLKTYHVDYERDEDRWWVATVRGIRGCHTQGRTINEARRRIREALKLFVDGRVRLEDHITLTAAIRQARARYEAYRKQAAEAEARARSSGQQIVRLLTKQCHLSTRDTGELLGLSHQRIQQLRQSTERSAR